MKSNRSKRIRSLTAAMLIALTAQGPAWALDLTTLPTGGQVVSGQGTISQSGSTLTVTQQTGKLIATWDTFNIGQNATVIFQQPSISSVALNRISDQNPSQIYGSLIANGQVFLMNAAGIYFGPTTQVDVGALVASSLNITNENFLSGNYLFENSGSAGSITSDGAIRTASGGYVAFISPQITNNGTITASDGTVALAAGDKVSLDFTGDHLVNFTVDQGTVDALIANNGIIQADGGTVLMTAKAADSLTSSVLNNTGVIEATGIGEDGGKIVLYADGGQTTISGTLDTSSDTAHGGTVIATGDRVLVESGAHLTASGTTGGGSVLVGGSWQGSDSAVHAATGTIVESGAVLEANATVNGDGGTVVAWSDVNNEDSVTRVYGTLEAMGGAEGGNGGRIETSGHWLDITGVSGSASAPLGTPGTWLLDPYSVTIASAASSGGSFSSGTWTPSASGSTILNTDINTLLDSGTNVTITTGSSGSENGDITVSSAITKASGTDATLTLLAAKTIEVDAAITNTSSAGKMNVVLNADSDKDGAGIIILNADISTGGGYLNFGAGDSYATISGISTRVGGDVYVTGSSARTLTTGGGAVNVYGEMIVANTSGLTVNSSGGDVHFYGLLNSGNSYTSVNVSGGITWSAALDAADANDTDGDGVDVGDSYLATITSRLENAVAGRTVNYYESWLGGQRTTAGSGTWYWVAGPEKNQAFFTQNSATTSGGVGGGTAINGAYTNWNTNEPNNYGSGTYHTSTVSEMNESALQFVGSTGVWNDLSTTATSLYYYVKETNLASSPVTINAGTGTVTFGGAVGTSKALASLTVTAATTNISGGAVTTDGAAGQSYSGNIVLGSASTVLTQTGTENDFTVASGKSITNSTGSAVALTIKNTGSIVLDTNSSISSSSGALSVTMSADTDSDGGYVLLNSGSSISSNGGNVTLGGTSGYSSGYGIYTASDAAISTGTSGNLSATSTGGAILFGGALTVGGTTSMTASGYDITAVNSGNDFGGAVTLTGKEIDLLDKDDLTLGAVTATGTVDIATTTDNMTLTGAVSTTDTSSSAVVLNAGKTAAAGTATGGSIIVSGGSVSTGTGGRAILYTGSVSGSTGLTTLIGSASGKFRYNSDETTTNYSTAIGSSGLYAIYREQPTITVTANNDSKTYNASAYSGNNGAVYSGLANGDTSSILSGTLTYGGTSQGAVNAGSYGIALTGNLTNGLGYAVAYADGTLTVNKANLTISTSAFTKTYDGTTSALGTAVVTSGTLYGADSISGGTFAFSDKNAGTNKTVSVSGVTVSDGNSGSNYNVTYTSNTNSTINKADLTISTTDVTKTYDGTTTSTAGTATVTSGTLYGTDSISGGTFVFSDKNAGTNKTVSVSGVTVSDGNNGGNYNVTYAGNTSGTINKADLTLSTTDVTKTYDGTTSAAGTATVTSGTLYGTDSISGGTFAFTDKNAGTDKTVTVSGVSVSDGNNGGNYNVTYASNTSSTINKADLTVTISNVTKTYDGTTSAVGTAVVTSGTLYGTDSLSDGTFAFTDKNAGTNKTVTVSVSDGNNGGNYNVTYTSNTVGTINKADLTVAANDDSKTYDGVPYSGGNGVNYAGFVAGEGTADLSGSISYSGTSQGATSAGSYTITPQGITSSNYVIHFSNGTLSIGGIPQTETTGTSLTSSQTTLNSSTQHESTTTTVNPGSGSTTLTNFASSNVVSGSTILTATQFSTPVSFSSTSGTTTLNIGSATSSAPTLETCTLPVFTKTGNAEPALQANVVVRQNDSALSLTQTTSTEQATAPEIASTTSNPPASFTLNTDSGAVIEFTVSVGNDGVLVVSSAEGAGGISAEQAVLMGMLTARQELKIDLGTLKAAVLVQP